MNQGKIWLVVKPTVGLPAFLGGVAVIALCVHAAILTHTDWYPGYYSGKGKAKVAVAPTATPTAQGVTAPVAATTSDTTVVAIAPAKAPPGK